ncbi:aldo/keto reductase [Caulobacter sp. 17J80-11]|uniref:aldo/keto reductase n=1 Tax=Caulobacter sp. 17J80-11 TaxID=2763502 RepID=UPI0016538726|nr:aldo/keto reductase [Caulobacter sp. 17J80-11]
MRYRQFGRSGMTLSAITLALTDEATMRGPQACRELIYAALEQGINSFHMASADPDLPGIVGEALSVVDRNLVFVSQRLGVVADGRKTTRDFSGEALSAAVDHALETSSLEQIDLVMLDNPSADEFPQRALSALKALRSVGKVRLLGVAGDNDAMEAYVSTGAFDVLATPYHLRSGWKERNRLKAAVSLDMGVLAYDWYPAELSSPKKVEAMAQPQPARRGFLFGGAKPAPAAPTNSPLQGMGTYAFLHQTKGWTAEEICLAYALTEPAVASCMVSAADAVRLGSLGAVPDRDLPSGLPAQIEMARFGPDHSSS